MSSSDVSIEIYAHTSPSGKVYVGVSSKGIANRWRQHVWDARRGSQLPFHRAIRKYGEYSFTHAVLERMTTESGARSAEKLWIRELNSLGDGGYNATEGGEGTQGVSPSVDHRAKISAANKGRKRSSPSAETRTRLSASLKGKVRSAEHRTNLSAAQMGKTLSAETLMKMSVALRGKTRSVEIRAKMSAAQKCRKEKPRTGY